MFSQKWEANILYCKVIFTQYHVISAHSKQILDIFRIEGTGNT